MNHFTEHGRFIHVIPDGPLTHTMQGNGPIPPPPVLQCPHPCAHAGVCQICGEKVIYHSHCWVKPLQPLAPSPWSPVAPTEPGYYWHWSGKKNEDAMLWLLVHNCGQGDPVWVFPSRRLPSEIGGFWISEANHLNRPDTSAPAPLPDRFTETLATACEKLEQQCRILRFGRFDETAAVIEGVAETLKAAYAAKGDK